jgi:hypothetical protein
MTDLTDSFCERCGVRYAFVANAPKGLSLKGARVLARGLRNFVFTDGQSINDAIDLARHEDNHDASTRIAEAFHRTFNFCMSCRQYACDRCWNDAAGACLSCVPAAEVEALAFGARPTVSRPLTAEELPILQTATPSSEAEWSLFPEDPVPDPASAAAPAPFYEPIVFSERPPQPPQRPAPQAWPAADLAAGQPAASAGPNGLKGSGQSGSNGKHSHHSSHKQGDAKAASVWPMADEIAPEMTLTPEELEIVEAYLSQASANRGPTAEIAAPEPEAASPRPLLEERQTWWNAAAPADRVARSADWALDDSTPEAPSPHDWVLATAPSDGISAGAREPIEEMDDDWLDEPTARETDLPPVSPRLLRRTSMSENLPPLTPPAQQPLAHEAGGLVARIFGRHAPEAEPAASARPTRASSRRNQPAGELWPRATAWSERSLEGRHWWLDAETTPARSAPQTHDQFFGPGHLGAAPSVAPEPAAGSLIQRTRTAKAQPRTRPAPQPVRSAPAPSQATQVDIDPRAAAALRLSAVEAAMGHATSAEARPAAAFEAPRAAEPADNEPAAPVPRSSAAREPAWLRIQREAAEPAPDMSLEVPDDTLADDTAEAPAPATQAATSPATAQPAAQAPATPWPPLGASWPTNQKPGAPWPAPDATPVPAVVAAQQAPAPTMAEMWVQSAQEVLNRGSVRVCHHCALPVSTKARFCRRCGTQQV